MAHGLKNRARDDLYRARSFNDKTFICLVGSYVFLFLNLYEDQCR